ncbi:MAG: lysylphosphatidylglycerol synthase domain-containing protein [Hyphomicrobiaceae bacterium]|nr:lysylphosphatidylglycerol synthase domain-containing protein [Hyphomicrobiaceae bacterium]
MSDVGRLVLIAKLVLIPLGVATLIYAMISQSVLGESKHIDVGMLGLAVIVNQVALTLYAIRMRSVLRVFNIALPYLDAKRIHLQSMFYYFFVPMAVGLEIARYVKIRHVVPNTRQADLVISLFADRLLGLVAAILVALAALPFVRIAGIGEVDVRLSTTLAAVFGSAIAVLVVAWRMGWLERGLKQIAKVQMSPAHVVPAIVACLLMQLAMGATVWAGAIGLGIEASLADSVFGVSIGVVAMVIPISVLGAGAAEVAGVLAFLFVGMSASEAAALAALAFSGKLIGAIQGGIWDAIEGGLAFRSTPVVAKAGRAPEDGL